MTQSQSFHIGDILSITTGLLMSPRHMEGIYSLLNFMTGDNLSTLELGNAADEAISFLFEQHPWLKDVVVTDDMFKDWPAGLTALESEWGAYHDVFPMHPEDHTQVSLFDVLAQYGFGKENIVNIDLDAPSPYGDLDWKDES